MQATVISLLLPPDIYTLADQSASIAGGRRCLTRRLPDAGFLCIRYLLPKYRQSDTPRLSAVAPGFSPSQTLRNVGLHTYPCDRSDRDLVPLTCHTVRLLRYHPWLTTVHATAHSRQQLVRQQSDSLSLCIGATGRYPADRLQLAKTRPAAKPSSQLTNTYSDCVPE